MNKDDVLALARAGFTAQQIAAILSEEKGPEAPPQPEPAPPAPADPAKAPDPEEPAKTPEKVPTPDEGYKELMKAIGGLADQIKQSAILGSRQPEAQTVDDILAAIIAPPGK